MAKGVPWIPQAVLFSPFWSHAGSEYLAALPLHIMTSTVFSFWPRATGGMYYTNSNAPYIPKLHQYCCSGNDDCAPTRNYRKCSRSGLGQAMCTVYS